MSSLLRRAQSGLGCPARSARRGLTSSPTLPLRLQRCAAIAQVQSAEAPPAALGAEPAAEQQPELDAREPEAPPPRPLTPAHLALLEDLGPCPLVKISTHYRVNFGDTVKVVGSSPEFGAWSVADAPGLTWGEGDVWTLVKPLPPGLHQFKVIVHCGNGNVIWESGDSNRIVSVPEDAGPGMMLAADCAFNFIGQMTMPEPEPVTAEVMDLLEAQAAADAAAREAAAAVEAERARAKQAVEAVAKAMFSMDVEAELTGRRSRTVTESVSSLDDPLGSSVTTAETLASSDEAALLGEAAAVEAAEAAEEEMQAQMNAMSREVYAKLSQDKPVAVAFMDLPQQQQPPQQQRPAAPGPASRSGPDSPAAAAAPAEPQPTGSIVAAFMKQHAAARGGSPSAAAPAAAAPAAAAPAAAPKPGAAPPTPAPAPAEAPRAPAKDAAPPGARRQGLPKGWGQQAMAPAGALGGGGPSILSAQPAGAASSPLFSGGSGRGRPGAAGTPPPSPGGGQARAGKRPPSPGRGSSHVAAAAAAAAADWAEGVAGNEVLAAAREAERAADEKAARLEAARRQASAAAAESARIRETMRKSSKMLASYTDGMPSFTPSPLRPGSVAEGAQSPVQAVAPDSPVHAASPLASTEEAAALTTAAAPAARPHPAPASPAASMPARPPAAAAAAAAAAAPLPPAAAVSPVAPPAITPIGAGPAAVASVAAAAALAASAGLAPPAVSSPARVPTPAPSSVGAGGSRGAGSSALAASASASAALSMDAAGASSGASPGGGKGGALPAGEVGEGGEGLRLLSAVVGSAAVGLVCWSEFVLKDTGCGLPPGPYGLLGAAEGLSYLAVLGFAGAGAAQRGASGGRRGLPGALVVPEVMAYGALAAGLLVLASQLQQYGYIPPPLPGGECYAEQAVALPGGALGDQLTGQLAALQGIMGQLKEAAEDGMDQLALREQLAVLQAQVDVFAAYVGMQADAGVASLQDSLSSASASVSAFVDSQLQQLDISGKVSQALDLLRAQEQQLKVELPRQLAELQSLAATASAVVQETALQAATTIHLPELLASLDSTMAVLHDVLEARIAQLDGVLTSLNDSIAAASAQIAAAAVAAHEAGASEAAAELAKLQASLADAMVGVQDQVWAGYQQLELADRLSDTLLAIRTSAAAVAASSAAELDKLRLQDQLRELEGVAAASLQALSASAGGQLAKLQLEQHLADIEAQAGAAAASLQAGLVQAYAAQLPVLQQQLASLQASVAGLSGPGSALPGGSGAELDSLLGQLQSSMDVTVAAVREVAASGADAAGEQLAGAGASLQAAGAGLGEQLASGADAVSAAVAAAPGALDAAADSAAGAAASAAAFVVDLAPGGPGAAPGGPGGVPEAVAALPRAAQALSSGAAEAARLVARADFGLDLLGGAHGGGGGGGGAGGPGSITDTVAAMQAQLDGFALEEASYKFSGVDLNEAPDAVKAIWSNRPQ